MDTPSLTESIAVFFAFLYVILAIKERRECWYAAIVSSCLYIPVFLSARLYTESLLQFFFIGGALLGLLRWNEDSDLGKVRISWWNLRSHIILILLVFVSATLLGYILSTYTNASLPYIDSLITLFSIATTILGANKIIENWLYWIVIDLVAVWVYLQKGLFLTGGLYGVYVLLAWTGFREWYNRFYKLELRE